jgi:hypothetical protein
MGTGLTTDPDDPELGHGADREPKGMNSKYLVLSEEERAKGFVRPVYRSYLHHDPECGAVTTMGLALCETYARRPGFYGATYCCRCMMHRPVGAEGEFTWVAGDGTDTGILVGTLWPTRNRRSPSRSPSRSRRPGSGGASSAAAARPAPPRRSGARGTSTVPDDVGTGGRKYLSQFSDVTSLLGSFSLSDPVGGNQGQPYLFAGDILVNMKGTSQLAVVCSDYGGWSAPPLGGSQRFRRLRVDIWADPVRDQAGGVIRTSSDTANRANALFTAVNNHLHRRDADTVAWGDLVTFGCALLTEPDWTAVPDGDWMLSGSAVYAVYIGGWTDALS